MCLPRNKFDLKTPCLLLDLNSVEENISKMARFSSSSKCDLRPHAKTHKLPWIAHKQIEAGAIGISCSKLQDAKAFVDAGIDDILITNQVVQGPKVRELISLSHFSRVMVCVDNLENARHLSEEAQRAGSSLRALIEVDVGINRCGVPPGKAVLEFAQKLATYPALRLEGLMGYEGGLFNMGKEEKIRLCKERNQRLIETKELLEQNGFSFDIVSAGGTNTYEITGASPGITEIQPGSYVTMDDWNRLHGVDFRQAVSILTTVVSRPQPDRIVVDAGLKALSVDHGFPKIMNVEGIEFEALNEEHGKLRVSEGGLKLKLGDKVELTPSHGCTTIPLYDRYFIVKGNDVLTDMKMISGSASY